jgi:hypothetical protein
MNLAEHTLHRLLHNPVKLASYLFPESDSTPQSDSSTCSKKVISKTEKTILQQKP